MADLDSKEIGIIEGIHIEYSVPGMCKGVNYKGKEKAFNYTIRKEAPYPPLSNNPFGIATYGGALNPPPINPIIAQEGEVLNVVVLFKKGFLESLKAGFGFNGTITREAFGEHKEESFPIVSIKRVGNYTTY